MANQTGNWCDKRVFVTGGTGFLGSWIIKKLVDAGAYVVALERDFEGHSYLIKSGYIRHTTRVRGDIRDYDLMERILSEYEIETVFHLASQSLVGVANHAPMQTLSQNIMGMATLLESARKTNQISRMLVSTSDKAYGQNDNLPYKETHPLHGTHPYDCSKSCQDLIAQTYAHSYDMPITIIRSGNMYGPGDINLSRLIPKTITRLLNGKPPIIYGNGQMRRDFGYVEDIADAFIMLAERGANGAFNVSGGEVLTVQEVVLKISELLGFSIPPIYQGVNNEIDSQWLDITKIRKLGWKPRHTFEQGLKKTIEYYKGAK